MLIGSEGTLGVITEAWVRVQERPRFKASVGVAFDDFDAARRAVREISQSGLNPVELPPARRRRKRAHPRRVRRGRRCWCSGSSRRTTRSTDRWRSRSTRRAITAGSRERSRQGADAGLRRRIDDAVGAWRQAFLAAPYLRDNFVALGVLSDTFETAITWDRFEEFHARVMDTARAAVAEAAVRRAAMEPRG